MPFDNTFRTDEVDIADDPVTDEWIRNFKETTRKLNMNNAKVFEVGPTGMLLIGDIPRSFSDGFDVILPDVKPGIWRVCSTFDEHTHLHMSWIAPGPLDVKNLAALATLCPKSKRTSVGSVPLKKLGTANVDSGQLGVIDGDMNNAVLEAVGDEEVAAQVLADPFSSEFIGEFALSGGYVINTHDGSYVVSGKKDDYAIIELAIGETAK